jgi:hypothetical protein
MNGTLARQNLKKLPMDRDMEKTSSNNVLLEILFC